MPTPLTPTSDRPRTFWRRQFFPSWAERKQMFATQAWIIVSASYAAIAFAYLLPQDFRNGAAPYVLATIAALMIRTFLFHLGLFVGALAFIAAVARNGRLVAAMVPLLVVTIGPVLASYRPRPPPRVSGESVKVMTVNLLYNNRQPTELAREIVATQPDLLLLQEYSRPWHIVLSLALATPYPYSRYEVRDDSFGLALYSRHPFVGPVDLGLSLGSWWNPEARAVIRIGERDVAVYNIHLLPPRGVEYSTDQRVAFADLVALLRHEPLPLLLCGDLNFTNSSAFADELHRLGLRDVQELAGRGPGTTWPVLGPLRDVPGIRLDHIYLTKELGATWCGTGFGAGSDHRPVIAEIGFRTGSPAAPTSQSR